MVDKVKVCETQAGLEAHLDGGTIKIEHSIPGTPLVDFVIALYLVDTTKRLVSSEKPVPVHVFQTSQGLPFYKILVKAKELMGKYLSLVGISEDMVEYSKSVLETEEYARRESSRLEQRGE